MNIELNRSRLIRNDDIALEYCITIQLLFLHTPLRAVYQFSHDLSRCSDATMQDNICNIVTSNKCC